MKERKGTSCNPYGDSIIKRCIICGDEFICHYPLAKYCSCRCINDAYIAQRKIRKSLEKDKTCCICGKEFRAKRKDTLYCSSACKQKAYRKSKSVTDIGLTKSGKP